VFYSFYSQVAGGLLSDEFLGKPGEDVTLDTSSKRKYASVLGYAGGYKWFQTLLETLRTIGDKHGGQTISNVAARWVLDGTFILMLVWAISMTLCFVYRTSTMAWIVDHFWLRRKVRVYFYFSWVIIFVYLCFVLYSHVHRVHRRVRQAPGFGTEQGGIVAR